MAVSPSSSSGTSSWMVVIGKVRPLTVSTGASPKWRLKRSASMVAELMISFRSGREGSRFFR